MSLKTNSISTAAALALPAQLGNDHGSFRQLIKAAKKYPGAVQSPDAERSARKKRNKCRRPSAASYAGFFLALRSALSHPSDLRFFLKNTVATACDAGSLVLK